MIYLNYYAISILCVMKMHSLELSHILSYVD